MIDQSIYEHLVTCPELTSQLTRYAARPAVFNQQAPADTDPLWDEGAQYARVIFALDMQNDPTRTLGGSLLIDAQCQAGQDSPERLETLIRHRIDGCFFSSNTSAEDTSNDITSDDIIHDNTTRNDTTSPGGATDIVAAQWADSQYFTEPTEHVNGVTVRFTLLAFPRLTTHVPDVIARLNEWTAARFPALLVIHQSPLPAVWKPGDDIHPTESTTSPFDAETSLLAPGTSPLVGSAIYWRVDSLKPAGWIPDTHQTAWRTALLRGHLFAVDVTTAADCAHAILHQLSRDKRLAKTGESPILVSQTNRVDIGADALRTGQITVEATFGEITRQVPFCPLRSIHYVSKRRSSP